MKLSKISERIPISRSESATLGFNKSSHVDSKSYSSAKDEGLSNKSSPPKNVIFPTIRVMYIYEGKIVQTDQQNFRSPVQKLTGRSIHTWKEKKRQTSPQSPMLEVVSGGVGTENPEDSHCNDHMPSQEKKSTCVSMDDQSDLTEGFNDKDMVITDKTNNYLLNEIPLIRKKFSFCNTHD